MSRRCRNSLFMGSANPITVSDNLNSGADCPRITKPGAPCIEPVPNYGLNSLYDSSFEQQLAVFGGGPNGDEIPRLSFPAGPIGGPPYIFQDDSVLGNNTFWARDNSSFADTRDWRISTANPNFGSFHARKILGSSGSGGGFANSLYPFQYILCSTAARNPPPPVDGAVRAGDLVKWGVYATSSSAAELHLWNDYMTLPGIDFGETYNDDVVFNLTTSYEYYEIGLFVGDDAAWLNCWLHVEGSGVVTIDVDDAVLSITGGGTILLCSQAGLITIDNDTTETSFL